MLPYTSHAITLLNDDAQKYVDNVIKQFEEDSQRFDHCPIVYPPLPPPGFPKEGYFRPKLMLWSPQEQFGIVIQCPLHGHELPSYQWTSDVSGKGGEMSRLVYDLMENVILIQRIYLCSNDSSRHWMRATTPDIHCCRVRSKYTNIFPKVVVKLDLFHACQRVTKTFSRQHSLYKDVARDFVQIFREDDDQGVTRLKRTPPKQKIEKNLNSFVDRLSNVPENPLSEATLKEISHIRQHVQKGCLSDIPPGCGTERNEGLHRLLNSSLISGETRISVQLAIALLTILFFYHNKKITAEKHICSTRVKPVAPHDLSGFHGCPSTMTENMPFHRRFSSEGSRIKSVSHSPQQKVHENQTEESLIIMAENVEDLCQESVAVAIITEMFSVKD